MLLSYWRTPLVLKSARFWSSSASCHHTPRSIQRIVRAMSSSTMNATAAVEAAAADTKAAEAVRKRAAGLALYEAKMEGIQSIS